MIPNVAGRICFAKVVVFPAVGVVFELADSVAVPISPVQDFDVVMIEVLLIMRGIR